MTTRRFELTPQRQKVSRLRTESPGRPVRRLIIRVLRGDASRHLDGMMDFFLRLPSLKMGWDQSHVDGNGKGCKLMCVVMGLDGKFLVLGWDGIIIVNFY